MVNPLCRNLTLVPLNVPLSCSIPGQVLRYKIPPITQTHWGNGQCVCIIHTHQDPVLWPACQCECYQVFQHCHSCTPTPPCRMSARGDPRGSSWTRPCHGQTNGRRLCKAIISCQKSPFSIGAFRNPVRISCSFTPAWSRQSEGCIWPLAYFLSLPGKRLTAYCTNLMCYSKILVDTWIVHGNIIIIIFSTFAIWQCRRISLMPCPRSGGTAGKGVFSPACDSSWWICAV